MRRGGPLKRKTRLQSRTPLQRGSQPLQRRTRDRRLTPQKRTQAFRRGVLRRCARDKITGLLICPVCKGQFAAREMDAHHIVEQERIKKYVRSLRLPKDAEVEVMVRRLWDARNGMAVCKDCHQRHTTSFRLIPREALPESAYVFATEIGLGYALDRYYA